MNASNKNRKNNKISENDLSIDTGKDDDQNDISDVNERENDLMQKIDNIMAEKNQIEKKLEEISVENTELARLLEDEKMKQKEIEKKWKNKLKIIENENRVLKNNQKKLEKELYPDDILTPSSTFKINIYPRQGHLKGKIEHPLTRDKKAFNGVDDQTILQFISNHLPQSEVEVQTSTTPKLVDFKTVPVETNIKSRIIKKGRPFQIKMKLDLSAIKIKTKGAILCSVDIYAKPFIGGEKMKIANVQKDISAAKILDLDIMVDALSEGAYKLETIITSTTLPQKKPAPITGFYDNGMLYVN